MIVFVSRMSYDFNKREDYDYSFSYDYLGGMGLGKSEVETERIRKSKLGTYDLTPLDPPEACQEVIKIAQMIHDSDQREALVNKIMKSRDERLEFVWNKKHEHNAYFEWALHCIDREVVGWQGLRRNSSRPAASSNTTAAAAADSKPLTINPPSDDHIRVGNTVVVANIKARPELNGKMGKIVSITTNDRVMVEFADINQIVSIAKINCMSLSGDVAESSSWPARLAKGLRVEIRGLTSDQGKLLNGLTGYIVDFKSDRYLVRLDGSDNSDLKSIKESNLFVPAPIGWTERVDASSGKSYYVCDKDGSVSWEHPLIGEFASKEHSTSVQSNEFVKLDGQDIERDTLEPVDGETNFNREEFLHQEAKRLKLDRRAAKSSKADVSEIVMSKLNQLREMFHFTEGEDLFSGNSRELLNAIRESSGNAKIKFLFCGFFVIFEDYKKLRFNKNQLIVLSDKISDVIDSEGLFPDYVIGWIESGLQIATPTRYSV